MRKRFFTGLVVVLPLAITFMILSFFIRLCTKPFRDIVSNLFKQITVFEHGWWIFNHDQVIQFVTTVSILCGILFLLFCFGLVGRWVFVHFFLKILDRFLTTVPLVGRVYNACRDFTSVLFSPQSNSFSQVAWVPFPSSGYNALGLVTNKVEIECLNGEKKKLISVLIPGVPNPTVGFLLLYPKVRITDTDLGIDTAIKWTLSCGSAEAKQISATFPKTIV